MDNGLSLSRMLLNQICGLPTDTIVMLKEEMADTDVEEVPAESLERVYSRRPQVAKLCIRDSDCRDQACGVTKNDS